MSYAARKNSSNFFGARMLRSCVGCTVSMASMWDMKRHCLEVQVDLLQRFAQAIAGRVVATSPASFSFKTRKRDI